MIDLNDFTAWPRVLEKGIQVAESCACRTGCQNCIEPAKSWNISNVEIDKIRGIELTRELLEIHDAGPVRRFSGGRMVPI